MSEISLGTPNEKFLAVARDGAAIRAFVPTIIHDVASMDDEAASPYYLTGMRSVAHKFLENSPRLSSVIFRNTAYRDLAKREGWLVESETFKGMLVPKDMDDLSNTENELWERYLYKGVVSERSIAQCIGHIGSELGQAVVTADGGKYSIRATTSEVYSWTREKMLEASRLMISSFLSEGSSDS